MDVDFYNSHIETICELKALADKHSCKISFGVRHYTENGATDISFFDYIFDDKSVMDDLDKCGYLDDESFLETTVLWFELYDPSSEEYHYNVMSYIETNAYAKYHEYMSETLKGETVEFIEENGLEWQSGSDDPHIFSYVGYDTEVSVFVGQEHPNVYRPGMAVKFFSDLVCDYLKEDRIIRTY